MDKQDKKNEGMYDELFNLIQKHVKTNRLSPFFEGTGFAFSRYSAQGKAVFSYQNVSTIKLTLHENIQLSLLLRHTEAVSVTWRETDIWHCVFTSPLLCAADSESVGGPRVKQP